MPINTATEYSVSAPMQMVPLSTILTDLSSYLDDSSDARWTAARKKLALRMAMEKISGLVKIEDIYETVFDGSVRDYTIPGYIEKVLGVERIGGIATAAGDLGPPITILNYRHFYDPLTNVLRFGHLQPDEATMRVRYLRSFQVPPTTVATLTGNMDASQTTIPVATPWLYPIPGYFQIDSEIVFYSGRSSTTLTGALRGLFNTVAATHTSAVSTADPLIPIDSKVHLVLILGAALEACKMRLQMSATSDIAVTLNQISAIEPEYNQAKQMLVKPYTGETLSVKSWGRIGGRRPMLT